MWDRLFDYPRQLISKLELENRLLRQERGLPPAKEPPSAEPEADNPEDNQEKADD